MSQDLGDLSSPGEAQPIDVNIQILPMHLFFMYLDTNITSNNLMLNFSSPKLVGIKHKFRMACFNLEHLYQIAVDTRLIFIMVESLKYCQKLQETL